MQTPFYMPECAKTHLQQSRISKFSGGGPRTPSSRGGDGRGREGRTGRGKGRREGKDREGRGGTGRKGGWGGEGRGTRHGLCPLETSSGSAPDNIKLGQLLPVTNHHPVTETVALPIVCLPTFPSKTCPSSSLLSLVLSSVTKARSFCGEHLACLYKLSFTPLYRL